MFTKFTAYFLILSFLLVCVPSISAQTKVASDDWDALNSYFNNEIAVKPANEKIVFGVLVNTDNDSLRLRTADKNNPSEVVLKREEIEKIWLAKLKSSSRHTLLGAGIGAGAGAGIGLIVLAATPKKPQNAQAGVAVPLLALTGAAVGGVIGYFARQKNKKERLIYQK